MYLFALYRKFNLNTKDLRVGGEWSRSTHGLGRFSCNANFIHVCWGEERAECGRKAVDLRPRPHL